MVTPRGAQGERRSNCRAAILAAGKQRRRAFPSALFPSAVGKPPLLAFHIRRSPSFRMAAMRLPYNFPVFQKYEYL